jgi:methionine-rich copper-binding protein CopC
MLMQKKTHIRFVSVLLLLFALSTASVAGGRSTNEQSPETGSRISLAPARVELEMAPGAEKTIVVDLDYHGATENSPPARIVASLNDWTIKRNGELEFKKANTLPNSASSWLIFSPAETTVTPGNVHSIRVTISVPKDATPGDHLTALIVEQRPDSIKLNQNRRQLVVRYRMAAVFYIKVPGLTRRGSLENLRVEARTDSVVVIPTLKNQGNSVVRPLTSVKVTDGSGHVMAELPTQESLPVLSGSELVQPVKIGVVLAPGVYSVKYQVDFQDGSRPTQGVTDLVVGKVTMAAKSGSPNEAGPAKP